MKRYRVNFKEILNIWGEVDATNKKEAIAKAKLGQFIPDTVDSEPLKYDFNGVSVEEIDAIRSMLPKEKRITDPLNFVRSIDPSF